ncbi:MAG: hypothetical protein V3S17_04375 [candidate division Zixibacteria bacterium]
MPPKEFGVPSGRVDLSSFMARSYSPARPRLYLKVASNPPKKFMSPSSSF